MEIINNKHQLRKVSNIKHYHEEHKASENNANVNQIEHTE